MPHVHHDDDLSNILIQDIFNYSQTAPDRYTFHPLIGIASRVFVKTEGRMRVLWYWLAKYGAINAFQSLTIADDDPRFWAASGDLNDGLIAADGAVVSDHTVALILHALLEAEYQFEGGDLLQVTLITRRPSVQLLTYILQRPGLLPTRTSVLEAMSRYRDFSEDHTELVEYIQQQRQALIEFGGPWVSKFLGSLDQVDAFGNSLAHVSRSVGFMNVVMKWKPTLSARLNSSNETPIDTAATPTILETLIHHYKVNEDVVSRAIRHYMRQRLFGHLAVIASVYGLPAWAVCGIITTAFDGRLEEAASEELVNRQRQWRARHSAFDSARSQMLLIAALSVVDHEKVIQIVRSACFECLLLV
jgi:hypothetical protein